MKVNIIRGKPKLRLAWVAMALGLAALLEIPLFALYSLIGRQMQRAGVQSGPGVGIFGILITLVAFITSFIIYRKGERSWVLWVGLISAIVIGAFWLLMIIAEIVSAIFGLGF